MILLNQDTASESHNLSKTITYLNQYLSVLDAGVVNVLEPTPFMLHISLFLPFMNGRISLLGVCSLDKPL